MTPQFSVIVPLYNKAPHVAVAVASALNQSLPPVEVIVVDDGSTDGSAEIVGQISDPRVTLLRRSPPGPGGYAARNLGTEAARTEWVAFLDADDSWRSDHLEKLAHALSAFGPDVGCAFSGVTLVYPNRRVLRPLSNRYLKPFQPLDLETMLRAWLDTGEAPMCTGAGAFRRGILLDAGLFPAGRARRGGDKDLWLRVMALSRCVYSGSVTAEFHQEAVNRVSNNTAHTTPPVIVGTIAAMLGSAPRGALPLLRRLSNLEITGYARHAAGRGTPQFSRFVDRLYFPEGIPALARVGGYYLAGLLIRSFRKRSTAQPLTPAPPASAANAEQAAQP